MADHPYTSLSRAAYWKTGVAELDPKQINLEWHPKAPIDRNTKIITVGSCFAQHISKSLKDNGFSWLDAEPAPATLPKEDHAKNGFGTFSFRTGNIYTAALLKQWIFWATGNLKQSTEYFLDNQNYFDPYRPSLTPDGYVSAEAMMEARRITLDAIIKSVRETDLFIFTLGLTEAWKNKDGSVYPMCPGTIRGTFSADEHVFHNYNEKEVLQDLVETFAELLFINPKLRFLLTVSPVPLTATAAGQHVLTATTYSKSVLRSAAGHLAQTRGDTDYFPSYELITAPVFEGHWFESNKRSVSSEGVAFVMGQFLSAIKVAQNNPEPRIIETTTLITASRTEDRDICDDIILESWANSANDVSDKLPSILLIGDSQMGMMGNELSKMSVRFAGGALMHGSEWNSVKFMLQEDAPFFASTIPDSQARWLDAANRTILKTTDNQKKSLWIITNIGLHARAVFSMDGIGSYLQQTKGIAAANNTRVQVTIDDIRSYVEASRQPHIQLLEKLIQSGYQVLWLGDPPTDQRNLGYFDILESIVLEKMSSIGCQVFSVTGWLKSSFGGFPEIFQSKEIDPLTGELDNIHGSAEYYKQLLGRIFSTFAIPIAVSDS